VGVVLVRVLVVVLWVAGALRAASSADRKIKNKRKMVKGSST